MAAIRLKNKHNGFTMLPDRFIDEYMPLASGEYVKVYLYLLRQANLSEPHISVEEIAEHLMHTEKDIIRALKYWEKQGLLSLSFSENHECDSIELHLPDPSDSEQNKADSKVSLNATAGGFYAVTPANSVRDTNLRPEPSADTMREADPRLDSSANIVQEADPHLNYSLNAPQEVSSQPNFPASTTTESNSRPDLPSNTVGKTDFHSASPAVSEALPEKHTYSPQEIEEITERESLEELIFVITSYMGRPLSQTELTSIIYFYDQLGFSAELIEYLFEYCISKNHKSIRYIEKTALNWAAEHISTPDEAKQSSAAHTEDCFAVLKAFGISGRNPVESEVRFVKLWHDDYGMSTELIVDACSRTMAAIHTPSFEYADGILSGWKKAGVKSPEDVSKLDAAFAAKKQQSEAVRQANRQTNGQSEAARFGTLRPTQTKFSNFEQRSFSASDDADLEKLLLARYRGQPTGT